MVRLKVGTNTVSLKLTPFQFHYGSIKSKSGNYYSAYNPSFQFHYGSIKRKQVAKILFTIQKFQFHYGSIKSKYAEDSTMVRLKVMLSLRMLAELGIFQFHYGSIKRRIKKMTEVFGM